MTFRDALLIEQGKRIQVIPCDCPCCQLDVDTAFQDMESNVYYVQQCTCEAEPEVDTWSCSECHTPFTKGILD